ncbi:MAG: hypothetical protein JWN34_1791 [Bryobacterales bacterium]|nr:hypothetical protein [Bryobacterales bacterium]
MPAASLIDGSHRSWFAAEGGGSNYGMLISADRRLSHSGIFFRKGRFLETRFCGGPSLASIARFRSGQRLRNSLRARRPL